VITEWNVLFEYVAGLPVHVSVFGFDPAAGVYVVMDPHHSHTEINLLRPSAFDIWIVQAVPGNEVLRIDAQQRTRFWFPGLWCVGMVKRVVGLRSGALSPAGLRRDLLRAGARRVFCEAEDQSPRGRPDDQGRA
jgi:hypothetical protein